LSFSNLISAFYETAVEIITQNTERSGTLDTPPAPH